MGIFGRKNNDPEPARNEEMVELGREYAIARRHRDTKAMNRIMRQVGNDKDMTDLSDFREGQESYDSIPPIRRGRNNRRR
ncbi:hypothetical protein ABZ471_32140 [Streptomyces sp. NPDC005728]|uniref:hypothetical protein n=1 Tax=Streptomyces sp. NPDC005728 TaxID=3157054 RepID=UPI0033E7DA7F